MIISIEHLSLNKYIFKQLIFQHIINFCRLIIYVLVFFSINVAERDIYLAD